MRPTALLLAALAATSSPAEELSPEERSYYEERLKEAYRLFYARAYRAALPLFAEVAFRLPTRDVLLGLSMSAYYSGRYELAALYLEQLLERFPNFHEARFYLALAYRALGREREAAEQFGLARAKLPPEVWRRLAQNLPPERPRFAHRLLFETGFRFDSNPAARPDIDSFALPSGAVFALGGKPEGWLWQVALADDLYYDAGERGGWTVKGAFDFLANLYLHNDEGVDLAERFDYYRWELSAAPGWERGDWAADLWLNVGQRFFGREYLSTFTGATPTLSYRLSPSLEGVLAYRFQYEDYKPRLSGQDVRQHTGVVALRYRWRGHRLAISGDGGHREARNDLFGYWEGGVNFSWQARWPFGIESQVQVAYHHRSYDAPFLLVAKRERQDNRFSSELSVRKWWHRNLFTEVRWDFFVNNANIELYDYRRHLVGVSLGLKF